MGARLAIDTGVLLFYFFGIVALGLWAGRRNKNLRDFSLGGRSIPWWAVLASIIAAETSAATFLGTPAEGFKTRGYFYGQLVIGTILARVFIAFTFIKPYYDYRVQSIYEFLTVRFGTKTKNMASGIFLFTRVLGIGVRLYLGGAIMVVIWRWGRRCVRRGARVVRMEAAVSALCAYVVCGAVSARETATPTRGR